LYGEERKKKPMPTMEGKIRAWVYVETNAKYNARESPN